MSNETQVGTATDKPARRRQRLIAVAGAVLATVGIWVIAVPLAGVDLEATTGPGSTALESVPLGAVIGTSLVVSLAGWTLLAVLERFIQRARTVWTVIALVVLVVSYGGPLFGAGIPTSSRVCLALMHTAVAAVLIPLYTRSSLAR